MPDSANSLRTFPKPLEAYELKFRPALTEVLAQCHEQRPAVSLDQNFRRTHARVVAVSAFDEILLEACDDELAEEDVVVNLPLNDTHFQLRGELARVSARQFRLTRFTLFQLSRRSIERVPLAPDTARLSIGTVTDGAASVRRLPVRDLSVDGVNVGDQSGAKWANNSLPLPAVLEAGGESYECLATLRPENGSETRGVVLDIGPSRSRLTTYYLRTRFPGVVDRRDLPGDAVKELFEESGYLALREDTAPSQEWLNEEGGEGVSRGFCYRASDGSVIGHISFTRSHRKAWLGHQIAMLRDHPEAIPCRRSLYQLITTYATLVDGDDTCVYGCFDLSKRWHQTFFCGFADWVGDPDLVTIIGLDRFERPTGMLPRKAPLPPYVEIDHGGADELVGSAALIRAQLPRLIADSFDIHPARLRSGCLHPAYREHPEPRARELFVLKVRGELAGAVLCETGPRSASLFNMLNSALFFFRTDDNRPDVEAQLALLSHVREFYAKRGDTMPIIAALPGALRADAEPGTVLAETMGLIAKAGRAMPLYASYLDYHFSKLQAKTAARHVGVSG